MAAGQWWFLAGTFGFLTVDELLELHERLIGPLREAGASGAFYQAWVIPYGLAALVLGAAYAGFLRRLPPKTRRWFVVAAILYVGGAVGLEMLASWVYTVLRPTEPNAIYMVMFTIEESLEMSGLVVFIHALADYARSEVVA